MAYAKLSGSLLVYKGPLPATAPATKASAPSVAPALTAADTVKLLGAHLKALKLTTFLCEYDAMARHCAAEGLDHSSYLLRLAQLELVERERRMVERRIKGARFPAAKGLESFDVAAIPVPKKSLVPALARCEYVTRREHIVLIGDSGTGKTHLAIGLGLAACRKGLSVRFTTAASLAQELLDARHDEQRLMRLRRRLAAYKVLIIDGLGDVPLSATGAELLSDVINQRCGRRSTIVTSKLPIDRWNRVFGAEESTDALLDRLTDNIVHFLELNGASYRSSTLSALTRPERGASYLAAD